MDHPVFTSYSTALIAPCGMNCGICLAYLRDKNTCDGCRADSLNKPKYCMRCIIRNCVHLEETTSKFCYECRKYPCTRLKQLDKRYRLKYKMSMVENLEIIQTQGIGYFIKRESERWLCIHCGGSYCVHKGYCLQCKQSLQSSVIGK